MLDDWDQLMIARDENITGALYTQLVRRYAPHIYIMLICRIPLRVKGGKINSVKE